LKANSEMALPSTSCGGGSHDGATEERPGTAVLFVRLNEVVPHDHRVREIAAVLDLSWVHSELAPHYPSAMYSPSARSGFCAAK